MMRGQDPTTTAPWRALKEHFATLSRSSLSDLCLSDQSRLDRFQISDHGLTLNYGLNFVTAETVDLLAKLALASGVEEMRSRMFGGEPINVTEDRSVLHTALRQTEKKPLILDGHDIRTDIADAQKRMAAFAEDVHSGRWLGATGEKIRHIVNIGIGGSDLGPRLAVHALEPYGKGLKIHFVANVDAFDLLSVIKSLDPAETLFVIVSKTFLTQETLLNAETARAWLTEKLGRAATEKHFVAVSSNLAAVAKFGISSDNVFPMWNWVGGRFSLWSAVGLSIMLAVGEENFKLMLAGAEAMDRHFCQAPLSTNMPVLLAMLTVWNRDFLAYASQAILPYCERLRDFPRFLQQLEMESNGKTVRLDGQSVNCPSAPVIWGESGTVGQHSFHQWLHQGSEIVPIDFIGVYEDDLNQKRHHDALLANLAAQAGAFVFGRKKASQPTEVYQGNRPANLIMLDRLDPFHFGALIALYEHKVFTEGIVWGLNSFDQPGVELGKQMARDMSEANTAETAEGAFLAKLFLKVARPAKGP